MDRRMYLVKDMRVYLMKFYYRLMIEKIFEARQVARARYSKFLTSHFLEMQEMKQKSNW